MKLIRLTQGKFTIVDDEDFEYLSQSSWRFHKGVAYNSSGLLHRIIANAPKGKRVIHHDGNKLNNQKHNLKVVSPSQIPQPLGESGFRGITRKADKWQAQIGTNGTVLYLGLFADKNDAIQARRVGETLYHAESEEAIDVQGQIQLCDGWQTRVEMIQSMARFLE